MSSKGYMRSVSHSAGSLQLGYPCGSTSLVFHCFVVYLVSAVCAGALRDAIVDCVRSCFFSPGTGDKMNSNRNYRKTVHH